MIPDDRLDPARRERIRAFERSERIERLGWVFLPFAAAGLVVMTPSPWRLWLALALAGWWLVGFFMVRQEGWEEPSLGGQFLFAPIAPFAVLLYSPFILLRGKDDWRGRRLNVQLRRIAAENVRVDRVIEGRVDLYDVRAGDANFNWNGEAKDALGRLRRVPDNAGRDLLWNAFPEKTTPPFRAWNAELERIGGDGNPTPVECHPAYSLQMQPLWIFDRTVLSFDPTSHDKTPAQPPEIEWEWEGTIEDGLERLRRVPDGSGREGVWDVFPDKKRSYRRVLDAEIERIGGGVQRWNPVGRVGLEDPALEPHPRWRWEGNAEDAIERLRRIPDGAGRDGIWRAFPDKVPAPERL